MSASSHGGVSSIFIDTTTVGEGHRLGALRINRAIEMIMGVVLLTRCTALIVQSLVLGQLAYKIWQAGTLIHHLLLTHDHSSTALVSYSAPPTTYRRLRSHFGTLDVVNEVLR